MYILSSLYRAQDIADGNLCAVQIQGIAAIRVNGNETLSVELLPGVENTEDFEGFSTGMRTYRR